MLDKLLKAIKLPEPQRSRALDQIGWDCMPDDTADDDLEDLL